MPEIVEKRELTPITKLFRVATPWVAEAAQPGQFVIVRVHERGERIPLTITDYDAEAGLITIVVQEVGATTRLLGALEQGDDLLDLVGPLGTPVEIPTGNHVAGVGGGFGAAALLCVMRETARRGNRSTAVVGARNEGLLLLLDELREISDSVEVCTDDGSAGYKGFVTGRLKELLEEPEAPEHVLAIGPMPMMRAVADTTRPFGTPTQVSLDPIMIDGTGMCGGCRVTIDGQVRFACVDGPFFDAHKVDYDEATRRTRMYATEQECAAEREQTAKHQSASGQAPAEKS